MYQQKPDVINKPTKSLSARAFPKSNKKYQLLTSRRNQTMPVEPLELLNQTKKQFQLDNKTSRILTFQPKKTDYRFFKPPEQLQEENYTLKMKINRLNEALGKQKSKKDHEKRNYSKVHQKLDVEYSQQKYFEHLGKNSNLVEGIKYQYYKMKQNYEDKCAQYDQLLKRTTTSLYQEQRIYREQLQADNAKLKSRIATFIKIEEKLYKDMQKQEQMRRSEPKKSENRKIKSRQDQINQLLEFSSEFTLLQKKLIDTQAKIESNQKKITNLKLNLRQKRKKIKFLDHLLTQKSNQVHHSMLRERRLAKQYKQQLQNVQKLKKQLKQLEERTKQSFQLLKQKQNKKFQTEKEIFNRSLKQKRQQNQKLKQEVYYLSTIISYIKTGQDPFKIEAMPSNISKKASYRQHSEQFLQNLQKTLISIEGDHFSNRKRVRTLIESGFKELNSPRIQGNTENLKQIQILSDSEDEGESILGSPGLRDSNIQEGAIENRLPKKSYLKHSEDSIKVRAVKPSQIDGYKKQLIYRFMYYKIEIDEVKQFLNFTFTKQQQIKISRRQRKWRNQYISLKEIKQKLQVYPFDLKQDEALLLSRYIVEDCTKDNIYYHQQNEIERIIAKSILRAFIGQYILPNDQSAKKQLVRVLGTSGKNLKSALQSLAPTGFISAIKFCEICESIQVDFNQETRNYIIGNLLAKSLKGLNQLEYGLIFQPQS